MAIPANSYLPGHVQGSALISSNNIVFPQYVSTSLVRLFFSNDTTYGAFESFVISSKYVCPDHQSRQSTAVGLGNPWPSVSAIHGRRQPLISWHCITTMGFCPSCTGQIKPFHAGMLKDCMGTTATTAQHRRQGMARHDRAGHGRPRHDTPCGMAGHGAWQSGAWHGTAPHGRALHGMTRHNMAGHRPRHDRARHDMPQHGSPQATA